MWGLSDLSVCLNRHHHPHNAGRCSGRHNESEKTLPPKISRVGAAAESVVVSVVVAGVGAAGAAMGAMMVGASLEVGGVMAAAAPVSAGFIANRSSSGAMSALPSVVAKGSLGRAGGVLRGQRVMFRKKRNGGLRGC